MVPSEVIPISEGCNNLVFIDIDCSVRPLLPKNVVSSRCLSIAIGFKSLINTTLLSVVIALITEYGLIANLDLE